MALLPEELVRQLNCDRLPMTETLPIIARRAMLGDRLRKLDEDGNLVGDSTGTHTGPVALPNDVLLLTSDGPPADGTEGTGAGSAGPGSLCVDYVNAKVYVNSNTKASPLWTILGMQTT